MSTQSIIIYRNPLEQAFWESGALVPIAVGTCVGLVVFAAVYNLAQFILNKLSRLQIDQSSKSKVLSKLRLDVVGTWSWRKRNTIATNTAAILGGIAGISTIVLFIG